MSEGFDGLIDFVGYPVGQGEAVAPPAEPVGFIGLLDFVGYPVSQGVATPTGNVAVAGKRIISSALAEAIRNKHREERLRLVQEIKLEIITSQLKLRKIEGELLQRRRAGNAVWSVVLSEL